MSLFLNSSFLVAPPVPTAMVLWVPCNTSSVPLTASSNTPNNAMVMCYKAIIHHINIIEWIHCAVTAGPYNFETCVLFPMTKISSSHDLKYNTEVPISLNRIRLPKHTPPRPYYLVIVRT